MMTDSSPYAPLPSWVYDFRGLPLSEVEHKEEPVVLKITKREVKAIPWEDRKLPFENTLVIPETRPSEFKFPSIPDSVDLLTAGLHDQGYSFDDIEEARSLLTNHLTISTPEEKLALLAPVFETKARVDLTDDTELFRILGPANASVDQDLTLNHICCRYGGHRMMTCVDFENYDEDTDTVIEDYDWYKGACDQCHLRLRSRAHAVRKPRPHGGWLGCYCSWKCVRESLAGSDLVTRAMIDRIELQIECHRNSGSEGTTGRYLHRRSRCGVRIRNRHRRSSDTGT